MQRLQPFSQSQLKTSSFVWFVNVLFFFLLVFYADSAAVHAGQLPQVRYQQNLPVIWRTVTCRNAVCIYTSYEVDSQLTNTMYR